MLHETIRRLMLPVTLTTIVGTVWIAAVSDSMQAQVMAGTWPALHRQEPDPRSSGVPRSTEKQATPADSSQKQ
jgi:hypothetical protein